MLKAMGGLDGAQPVDNGMSALGRTETFTALGNPVQGGISLAELRHSRHWEILCRAGFLALGSLAFATAQ